MLTRDNNGNLRNGRKEYKAFAREFGKHQGIPIGVELEAGGGNQWRTTVTPQSIHANLDAYGYEVDDFKKAYYSHWVKHYCDARTFMFYASQDGSVSFPDMELKFWPASVMHWYRIKPRLTALFDDMRGDGLSSGSAVGAGIHMHISRKNARMEALYAILYATAKHRAWWERISDRTPASFERWCNVPSVAEVTRSIEYDSYGVLGHCMAANIEKEPRNTLELRVFSGTLDVQVFLARIEFMNLLYQAADKESARWPVSATTGWSVRNVNWFNPMLIADEITPAHTPNLAHMITTPNQSLYNLGL